MADSFMVGPGIVAAMKSDETTPASDEIFTHRNRPEPLWSEAMGQNGTIYRWVKATNTTYRFPADS
ncbi:MAG TPA: hypothetical protein VFH48_00980 [Chloroflexota bacterium]|nr:hypothetical protein [Chloroflexota bacterium]